jgi:hypothetical protein
MRLKSTTLGALFLMFLLVAQTAPLTVTNDVNTTMLTSETNGEDSFSVSARNGSSWSSMTNIDYQDDIGYHSSLAIDSNDHLHVTYSDDTNGNLEYMTHDGSSWSTPISPDSSGNISRYSSSSLAIDSNDHLHVTYSDDTNGNLEYLTHDGSSWSTPVSLDSRDYDAIQPSLAIDSNDNLHVTYGTFPEENAFEINLEYMTYDGSSWSTPISLDRRSGVGSQSSLAIDSNDNLHVTYRDYPNASLEYMTYDGSSWSTPISLDSNSDADDYILAPSLAIDSDDRLHVTYYDRLSASLEYVTYDGSSWSTPLTLDTQNCLQSSLAIDSNDHLHVTYHCDRGRKTLEYISHDGSSWSTRTSIHNSAHNDAGYHPSLAIDSNDNLHVTFMQSRQDRNLAYSTTKLDLDRDGVQDSLDNCVSDANADQADYDSDNIGDVCDTDADGDDVLNVDDTCPMGMNTWVSNSTNDNDGDGCNDSYEDLDDDNDGITDETEADTGSNPLDADSDADGYQDGEDVFPTDSTEWTDSDGDGFGDNSDACPDVFGASLQPVAGCLDSDSDGWADDSDAFPYDPEEWSDSDLDEVGDNSDAFPTDWKEWNDSDNDLIGDNSDACPDVFGTSLQPIPGCPDSDSDGWADSDDVFPNDDSEWNDGDADGVGDNADSCPLEFGTSTQIERYGCPDDNELDANETLDSDGDGVEDNSDNCPGTTNNTVVDLEGCIITVKSTSDTASNFLSDSATWTAIIALFVAIIGVAAKVRSGGRGKDKQEESVAQQVFAQTNPTMNSLSKPSAQVMANNGIESGYELLQHEGNNYYRVPGSWSEWTQYQR